ncbi:GNAT family N-acetyltransferase [Humidisolicoccus flavus]|uniref:GNAT family N-acetyltransferase n=1 Tax=Humidisolicoccus flavus TaxID=3111414 RepID=UPI003253187C
MTEFVELRQDGLILNAVRASDAPRVTAACQRPVAEQFLTTPWPYTSEDSKYFLETWVPEGWADVHEETVWAIRETEDGDLLGVIGLRNHTHELGYWLTEDAEGRGVMTRAVEAVVDHAFRVRGMPLVYWEAHVGNWASLGVARRTGFSYHGTRQGKVTERAPNPVSWFASRSNGAPFAHPVLEWPTPER